ncbi:MAG: hypothetical protein HYZ07_01295, partial [Candidatus Harrisonbacteria bacterium]|nr:hypothetical protein [Candidatus Harrisonbacteria bacterium]
MKHGVAHDIGIIVLSVIAAVLLAKTGALQSILTATREIEFVGSFIAGIFFTSIFTTAPAMVVLGQIAQANSPLPVALFGGLGALLGDLIIFRFVKDRLSEDMLSLLRERRRIRAILHRRFFRYLTMFLGTIIIASPLPDELGLALLGFSKVRMSLFVPFSFFANAAG